MAHILGSKPFQVTPLTDLEVAQRLHDHIVLCDGDETGECVAECDYRDRVYNTFLILRTIRATERKACEDIARTSGSARAADMIRDRVKDDDKR